MTINRSVWLRRARILTGMTAKQLAEKSELSLNFIQRVENGTRNMSDEVFQIVCRELGFIPEELNLDTRVLIDKIDSLIEEYGENSFCLLKMTEVIDRPYYVDCEYQDLESLKDSSITEIPSCLIRLKYAKKNVEYQQMMYEGAFF